MKKNILNSLNIIILTGFLTACGDGGLLFGGKTNPLDGKEKIEQGGQDNPSVDEKPVVYNSQLIRIESPELVTFNKGKTDSFKVGVTVFEEGYTSAVEAVNLTDFPGAQFDESKSEFIWSPDDRIFFGSERIWSQKLILRAAALKTGEAPQVKEKEIYIIVERGTLGIQIQKIEAPNGAELNEKTGEVKLEVTVEDLNKPTETGAWPALLLVSMDSVNDFDLAPYAKVLTPESLGNGLFKFRINIAPKKNIVSTSQKGIIAFQALSKVSGEISTNQQMGIPINNELENLLTDWIYPVTLAKGQIHEVPFSFWNERGEGFIDNPFKMGGASEIQIKCNPYNNSGSGEKRFCKAIVDLSKVTSAVDLDFSVRVKTRDKLYIETGSIIQDFKYSIRVR